MPRRRARPYASRDGRDTNWHACRVIQETSTTAQLADAWRDAVRAAELAERLSRAAAEAITQADRAALQSRDVAAFALRAAEAADRAAETARVVAQDALDADDTS